MDVGFAEIANSERCSINLLGDLDTFFIGSVFREDRINEGRDLVFFDTSWGAYDDPEG